MNKINAEGLVNLEQPFIKVPLEQFKRACKTSQKHVEKDFTTFINSVQELCKVQEDEDPEKVLSVLESQEARLQNLKRSLSKAKIEEDMYASRTKARLIHLSLLNSMESIDSEEYERWSRIRLNRILVDYMLRNGYSSSAEKLALDLNIKDFVDLELFAQSRRIENAIKTHSCQEALAWCHENKSTLKKLKSNLEFNLRFQEYVELIRVRKLKEAIVYAKKWLTPMSDVHLKEIQQGMALLAFPPQTQCGIYKVLFDDSRWDKLVLEFKKDNYELHNLTTPSLLNMTLQVGLSALKTHACYQDDNNNINCPVCAKDTFGILASTLPHSHHVNSCIVCRITGDLMNENNPPMVLPNGNVYSTRALQEMADRNQGKVECPRTGSVFTFSQCRKAFIS